LTTSASRAHDAASLAPQPARFCGRGRVCAGLSTGHSVNADRLLMRPIVLRKPGCSDFISADSFAMVRGGRIDLTVLGALQVDEDENLAG
jgi:hypothetical protein